MEDKINSFEELEDLITIGEAAELLGVCIKTLRNWHANGRLMPAYVKKTTKVRYYKKKLIMNLIYKEKEEQKEREDIMESLKKLMI